MVIHSLKYNFLIFHDLSHPYPSEKYIQIAISAFIVTDCCKPLWMLVKIEIQPQKYFFIVNNFVISNNNNKKKSY